MGDEFFELGLHVYNFLLRELEFHDWDTGGFQVGEETNFGWLEEEEGAAFAVGTTGLYDQRGGCSLLGHLGGRPGGSSLHLGSEFWLVKIVNSQKGGVLTSRPLAATSVQMRVPCLALQNSKKVFVRFCCFCLPWRSKTGRSM